MHKRYSEYSQECALCQNCACISNAVTKIYLPVNSIFHEFFNVCFRLCSEYQTSHGILMKKLDVLCQALLSMKILCLDLEKNGQGYKIFLFSVLPVERCPSLGHSWCHGPHLQFSAITWHSRHLATSSKAFFWHNQILKIYCACTVICHKISFQCLFPHSWGKRNWFDPMVAEDCLLKECPL